MGGGVNPAGQARGDAVSGFAQITRQPDGHLTADDRTIARADNGDHRHFQYGEMTFCQNHGRSAVDGSQPWRIIRFSHGNEFGAKPRRLIQFRFDIAERGNADFAGCSAASGQIGQGFQSLFCGAEVIDQIIECGGPYLFAANEAQPVQPLAFAERNSLTVRVVEQAHALSAAFEPPILLSVPFSSRRIFWWCLSHNSIVSTP